MLISMLKCKLHRATVVVWVLGVVHTIGAGTDASATARPDLVIVLAQLLQLGRDALDCTRLATPTSRSSWLVRPHCLAGHVGLELANVVLRHAGSNSLA